MTSRGRALEALLSVGLIGDRELADRALNALSAGGMEGVRIGPAESRPRLGQGLDVLVVSGGSVPAERISTIRRICERAPGVAVVVILQSIGDGVARAMIAANASTHANGSLSPNAATRAKTRMRASRIALSRPIIRFGPTFQCDTLRSWRGA